MTTCYRDDRVRITSFEVRVDAVWHRRGRPDARSLSRRTARWLLIAAAIALIVACAAKTPALFMLGARVPSLTVRIALAIAGSLAFLALAWPIAELVRTGCTALSRARSRAGRRVWWMTTFYRDASVEVTSRAVEVDGRSYALRELATVWHRAGGRARRTLATRAALVVAPLAPLVAAAGVAAIALRLDLAPANRLALLVLAGLLGLLAVPLLDLVLGRVEQSYDRGTRVHEIWARWRGREILLLRTGDRQRFGRIYRALQRALERTTVTPSVPTAGREERSIRPRTRP